MKQGATGAGDASTREATKHVLIVDDHPVVRHGFRQLLEDQPGLTVSWEAGDASEALRLVDRHEPDLALVDIALGSVSGIEFTKQLSTHHEDLPVLIVSMYDETLYAERALAAGARGYVMKRAPDEELVQAVRQVLGGGVYLSERIRDRFPLLDERMRRDEADEESRGEDPVDRLSDRELEVFLLLGEGLAPRHIAERLSLSVKTVETYRRHLKDKLNLESSNELSRYAVAWCRRNDTP